MRGAPAIAIVGTLSVALELKEMMLSDNGPEDKDKLRDFIHYKFEHLKVARPTAVNLSQAGEKLKHLISDFSGTAKEAQVVLIKEMENMLAEDIDTNRAIGRNGATHIISLLCKGDKATILTHCNTGSLATAGYGTALGVIRSLFEMDRLQHVYCTETRPYNQGARLTAYELVHERIPSTLICDSMVGLLLLERKISAIVVGADRVVANGDTANKIGTYQLAVLAQYHDVPFFVAAPMSTVDFTLATGKQITIEERPEKEMLFVNGLRVASEGIGCWNPAFDITPAHLITGGIITELGLFEPGKLPKFTQ